MDNDDLLIGNSEWIRKKNLRFEKIDEITFYSYDNKGINEIFYNKINNIAYEYIIDCDKLSNLVLFPIDTKIYMKMDLGNRWIYYGGIIGLAIVKPSQLAKVIDISKLIGGGYIVMGRYIIDKGDKIKFITKKKIDPLHITFTNVLRLKE